MSIDIIPFLSVVLAKFQMAKPKGQGKSKCQSSNDKQNPNVKIQITNEAQMSKRFPFGV